MSQKPLYIMEYNYALIYVVLLRSLSCSATTVYHSSDGHRFKWLSPFNNQKKLEALCTQHNRQLIMHRSGESLLYRLFRHDVLCWPEIERYVPSRHIALVWFMQALQYCEVNHILSWQRSGIQYNRTFQILVTRAAFVLVCQQSSDVDLYGLIKYADLFRMLFEDNNTDRSDYLLSAINNDSRLLKIVLRTRIHLQLFSITAVKLRHQLDKTDMCIKQQKEKRFIFANNESDSNSSTGRKDFIGDSDKSDNDKFNCCRREIAHSNMNLSIHARTSAEIRNIAWFAEIGLYIETFLLLLVVTVTVTLLLLLWKTYKHLSTKFDGTLPASLIITETLNANLFEANKFVQQMVQETLYSLAQNGSLLGLTNLLILILVLINRSMAGESIRLSRNLMLADYNVFGDLCDRILPFHNFGVYLLRGHTLFTLTCLVIALVIFIVTVCYHRHVREQNDVLSGEKRECKPQRRREMLFNTLLLSICAHFISIVGQSFVEIAVFWSESRADATEWFQWFQLARIAAFVDPLFNPLVVALRVPVMNAKLRWIWRCVSNTTVLICCQKRAKKRSKQKRFLASTTAPSSKSSHTIHSDDFFPKLLCHRNLQSKFASSYRRSHSDAVPVGQHFTLKHKLST
ncbi:unnamed protein product [Litomosoides sigmodontis]|uniref:Uncharacterized protein n=1 Tax=Litomosoides sigmodontis TaxID=42156 RepID=A0A3P6TVY7_LITSI|nr:unnamed protein product [Litomosoides sigmodontis]